MSDFSSSQIFAASRPNDFPVVIDKFAAQKRVLHPPAEFDTFERRVTLYRFRFGGTHHETFVRIDDRNIRVVTWRDVSLAWQPETLRRLPAQKLGHVVVGHAALAALAQDA